MRSFIMSLAFLLLSATVVVGGPTTGYGTIIYANGTMIAIYRAALPGYAYYRKFTRGGKAVGGCQLETIAHYQLRKAFMKASAKWRRGYVPRKLCK